MEGRRTYLVETDGAERGFDDVGHCPARHHCDQTRGEQQLKRSAPNGGGEQRVATAVTVLGAHVLPGLALAEDVGRRHGCGGEVGRRPGVWRQARESSRGRGSCSCSALFVAATGGLGFGGGRRGWWGFGSRALRLAWAA